MYPIATLAAATALLLTAGCTADQVRAAQPPATAFQSGSSASASPAGSAASASQAPASAPARSTTAPARTPVARAVTSTAVPAPHTQQVVRRPVTARGQVAAGYTLVADPPGYQSSCSSRPRNAYPSPVAVDAGPVACGASAEYALACWGSLTADTALCYRNPWQRQVVRINTGGRLPVVAPPAQPSPLGMVLGNGVRCTLRDGGAWSRLDGHPELIGTYACKDSTVVWGVRRSDGIDRTGPLWKVWLAPMSGHGKLYPMAVRTAYFVGTARS